MDGGREERGKVSARKKRRVRGGFSQKRVLVIGYNIYILGR